MSRERQKGTTEETAIVNDWNGYMCDPRHVARRMPAASRYDVHVDGSYPGAYVIDILSTRQDRGERLVTMRFKDLMALYGTASRDIAPSLHIESKRYARFALHGIFFSKFGKKK